MEAAHDPRTVVLDRIERDHGAEVMGHVAREHGVCRCARCLAFLVALDEEKTKAKEDGRL